MPAVSTMKQQDVAADDDADRRPSQSPAPLILHQPTHCDDRPTPPRYDVIVRSTSGPVTSQVDPRHAPVSSSASSPETGWRAVTGGGDAAGGSLNRLPPPATTQTWTVSSPADGEPADAALTAASPTVARTSETGSTSCDPLATLMRLYGTLSDNGRLSSSPLQQQPGRLQFDHNSPAATAITSLPVASELSTQAGTSVPAVNNGDYIMKELSEADDEQDGPIKSYVCHVCQYIGQTRINAYCT